MFLLFRAITYSTLFIGVLLVFLPAQVLGRSGLETPRQAPEVSRGNPWGEYWKGD